MWQKIVYRWTIGVQRVTACADATATRSTQRDGNHLEWNDERVFRWRRSPYSVDVGKQNGHTDADGQCCDHR